MAPVVANLTVVGSDRTGVVARFTNLVFEAGGNIEALEERVRRGRFHMLLQANFERVDERALRRDLKRLSGELDMETRVTLHHPGQRRRMAILVTREPHCLEAIVEAVRSGRLEVDPVVVVGNRKDLAGLAESLGLPFHYVPWASPARGEARVLRLLDRYEVDLIALARFIRILSPSFVWRYPNRIVNVHPSLLPSFPGASAYRQAWEHGVRVAGATAHFVTPDLDEGPILAQKAFQLRREESFESLRARGQQVEAEVLLEALELCLREDLDIHWGRVWFTPEPAE